jgi:hypothetical protein
MKLFGAIKNYVKGVCSRFTSASRRDQGIVVGGLAGATYTSLRALYTVAAELNVPLAGRVAIANPLTRAGVGLLVGYLGGSTMFNRYGQIAEAFEGTAADMQTGPDGEMNNLTFMMKTWPFIISVAANLVMFAFPVPGGSPIFATIRVLSTTELGILTTLNGLFVGGTFAHRIGKTLDMITGGQLVADFGIFTAGRKIRACSVPKSTPEERAPLLAAPTH